MEDISFILKVAALVLSIVALVATFIYRSNVDGLEKEILGKLSRKELTVEELEDFALAVSEVISTDQLGSFAKKTPFLPRASKDFCLDAQIISDFSRPGLSPEEQAFDALEKYIVFERDSQFKVHKKSDVIKAFAGAVSALDIIGNYLPKIQEAVEKTAPRAASEEEMELYGEAYKTAGKYTRTDEETVEKMLEERAAVTT